MVNILFVQEDSIYKKIRMGTLECWDITRDARKWGGGTSIVAHPPCGFWCRLRGLSKPAPGEASLAPYTVKLVREYGGIMEHPAHSKLWGFENLPRPGTGKDGHGGWSLSLDQFWFGHKAKKPTWLYIVGCEERDLPPVPLRLDCITHVILATNKRGRLELSKKERSATPPAFAEWLVQAAEIINSIKQKKQYDYKD
jgi:hypothetical protein